MWAWGVKGISLPATWLGLVVHSSLSPHKTVFVVFPLLQSMKSWNRTELFDSTNSVQGLLTGRLRRWSIVYAQNSMFIWENGNAFSGPPQPPHLHIRVHRSYSQLIKSDYLSYCRAVMCLKNLFSNLGSKLIVFHALYMVPYILGE